MGKARPRSRKPVLPAPPRPRAPSVSLRAEAEPRLLAGGDRRSLLLFGQDQGVLRLCLGLIQPPCLGDGGSVARSPARVYQESRATKRSVWRVQAGPPKELRVLGRDLEQTTAGLCPHTEPGSGCLGSRCAGGRRSRPPSLARSQERPRWL